MSRTYYLDDGSPFVASGGAQDPLADDELVACKIMVEAARRVRAAGFEVSLNNGAVHITRLKNDNQA